MPQRNPTPIAQAQGAVERAWELRDNIYEQDGGPAMMMEATYAAVYCEDLLTLRYAGWQIEGGQSSWSPLDRYDPRLREDYREDATSKNWDLVYAVQ